MASKALIAPSILSADFAHLADQIAGAENDGADLFHIDVMDGHFVPNLSLGPLIVEACRRSTGLPLDVHLMIEQPEKYMESFIQAGADHVTVHVEASDTLNETLKEIKKHGVKAGVALSPATPASSVESALAFVDIVLVMSVNPGFGGQAFIPDVLPKIRQLRETIDQQNLGTLIEIDGGIDESTLPAALEAGVDIFVAGSAIFGHPKGIAAGIQALQNAALAAQDS
jgi:ribulose-phosphate 3-epimerase